jgi:O-antigen/teichoic acid export membrane protein
VSERIKPWSLKKNIAWVVLGEGINRVLPLLVLSHAIRNLGSNAFGHAQFVLNVIETAIPFVVFGYTYTGVIDSVETKTETDASRAETFLRLCILRAMNAVVAITVGAVVLFSVPSYREAWLPFLAFSPLLLLTAFDATYLFLAEKQTGRLTRATASAKIVFLLGVFIFVQEPDHKWRFVLCMLGVNAATLLYGIVTLAPNLFPRERNKLKAIVSNSMRFHVLRDRVWNAVPFAAALVILPFFERGDVFAMERLETGEVSGTYQAFAKLAQSVVGVASAVLLPFFSEFANETSLSRIKDLLHVTLVGSTTLASAAFLVAVFFDVELGSYFLGHPSTLGKGVLQTLFLSLLPTMLIYILGFQILMLKKKQFLLASLLAVGFLIPTGLTFFTPTFGAKDAFSLALLFLVAKVSISFAVSACAVNALPQGARPHVRFYGFLSFLVAWCGLAWFSRFSFLEPTNALWVLKRVALGGAFLFGLGICTGFFSHSLGLFKFLPRPRFR